MTHRRGARRVASTIPLVVLLLLLSFLSAALPRGASARAVLQQEQQEQQQQQLTADPSSKDDFDFFFLVRQYPPTFCNDHRCSHSPPRGFAFTIHGLWPQRADGTWPEFCGSADAAGGSGGGGAAAALSLWRLRDLLPALARAWPSWTASDRAFWAHEWLRHGTCAAPAIAGPEEAAQPGGGQHAFFAAVLQLHKKYSVENALAAAEIEPSQTARYPVSDLVEAVHKAHGVRPHVTCDFHGNLAEVWYCVAKDGKEAVDCGGDGSGSGSGESGNNGDSESGRSGGGGGGGGAFAADAARSARHAALPTSARGQEVGEGASAGASSSSSLPPPSNAFCRSIALPPPANAAGWRGADEAPLVTLAGIVVCAAVAAARGRQWFLAGGEGGGAGVRRPLVAAAASS